MYNTTAPVWGNSGMFVKFSQSSNWHQNYRKQYNNTAITLLGSFIRDNKNEGGTLRWKRGKKVEQEETLGVGGAGYTKDASGLSRRQQGKGENRGGEEEPSDGNSRERAHTVENPHKCLHVLCVCVRFRCIRRRAHAHNMQLPLLPLSPS